MANKVLISSLLLIIFFLFCGRTLLAFGVHIGLSDEHAEENVKHVRLSNKYIRIKFLTKTPTCTLNMNATVKSVAC